MISKIFVYARQAFDTTISETQQNIVAFIAQQKYHENSMSKKMSSPKHKISKSIYAAETGRNVLQSLYIWKDISHNMIGPKIKLKNTQIC